MPSQRTGGGYCKWAVVDTHQGNKSVGGELTLKEAAIAAGRMNAACGAERYTPGRFVSPHQYEAVTPMRERTR
jgi:hypothetical protein